MAEDIVERKRLREKKRLEQELNVYEDEGKTRKEDACLLDGENVKQCSRHPRRSRHLPLLLVNSFTMAKGVNYEMIGVSSHSSPTSYFSSFLCKLLIISFFLTPFISLVTAYTGSLVMIFSGHSS